jgi:hypothetical protein
MEIIIFQGKVGLTVVCALILLLCPLGPHQAVKRVAPLLPTSWSCYSESPHEWLQPAHQLKGVDNVRITSRDGLPVAGGCRGVCHSQMPVFRSGCELTWRGKALFFLIQAMRVDGSRKAQIRIFLISSSGGVDLLAAASCHFLVAFFIHKPSTCCCCRARTRCCSNLLDVFCTITILLSSSNSIYILITVSAQTIIVLPTNISSEEIRSGSIS